MKPHTKVKKESVDCDKIEGTELRACRVCLSTQRKLYDIHGNAVLEEFRKLTGIQVSPTDGFPQHICAICGTWLKKSAAFQILSWRSKNFLQELHVQNPVITTQLLRKTDTTCVNLPFTTTNTLVIECITNSDSEIVTDDIKEENSIEHNSDLDIEDNFEYEYTSVEYLDPEFEANSHDSVEIETHNKNEDNVDDTEDNIDDTTASSLRNTQKKKKIETNITRKPSKRKKSADEITDVSNINLEQKEAVTKIKRMYNSKTKEEFENSAKMYNAEVIFLTREQQMAELQARKESKDYNNSRFQCKVCYRSFMKESAYTRHMAWHDPSSGSHVCDICKLRYKTPQNLREHLRRWHRMRFICKLCNNISKNVALAKLHFKWHEGFKYECKHCGKNFNKASSHMNHVREVHTEFTCDTCGQHVQGTRGLTQHRRLHVGTFKCTSCESKFRSEEALSRHLENINGHGCDHGMKPCAQCGAGFQTSAMLREHMTLDHIDKIFQCEKCKTTCISDLQLAIHWSRAHRGERVLRSRRKSRDSCAFMCELCAKSFSNEAALRYHQRIHTGEKPYACTYCPKRFRMKVNLMIHLNTHTGARPYKCALCPETFKSHSQKHKHRLLVHTKERPYKCHMCKKTYIVSCDLKMHIRTAHMNIPRPPPNRRQKRGVTQAISNA